MTHPSTVADTLDAAAERVDNGWCQHLFATTERGVRCFCALGAIADACGLTGAQANFQEGVPGVAAALLRDTIGSQAVDDWNDDPERTQQDVSAKLREAAAKARGEVQP